MSNKDDWEPEDYFKLRCIQRYLAGSKDPVFDPTYTDPHKVTPEITREYYEYLRDKPYFKKNSCNIVLSTVYYPEVFEKIKF